MAMSLIRNQPTKQRPVKLQRDPWELSIRPERGGRITSLRLRGEELLDQGIGVDDPLASGFVQGGAWGWDEMVPNVSATDQLPDHGEAWRVAWEVVDRTTMRARGRVVPWVLERTIELEDAVRIAYAYTNAGTGAHRPFWCAHPLFKLTPEMEPGVPMPAEGSSAKVYLEKGSTDAVRLRWGSTAIEMAWDRALTPFVSVWVCNGDLGGYRQVAVEPALGGHEAAEPDAPLLEPGATLRWWLQIHAL
jgi:galactose mutarotase-like enzyme